MKVTPAQNILHTIFGVNEWNFVLFCIILMKGHLVELLNKAIVIIIIIIIFIIIFIIVIIIYYY